MAVATRARLGRNQRIILKDFAGQRFTTADAAFWCSNRWPPSINSGSMQAARSALRKLEARGLVRLVQPGPRGGLESAVWEVVAQ